MDSLLELMSSGGISSMSVSLCSNSLILKENPYVELANHFYIDKAKTMHYVSVRNLNPALCEQVRYFAAKLN